jgi:hypothetical protein
MAFSLLWNQSVKPSKSEIQHRQGLAKELIDDGESIPLKYKRATRYPWLPILPDLSDPRNSQYDKRLFDLPMN